MKQYLQDFSSLFFPQTCVGCDASLTYQEKLICTACWYHLPYTNFHKHADNESARQLWGRVKLEAVTSYIYFQESSRVQNMLHHFKYRNTPEVGTILGLRYGEILQKTATFNQVDLIVPVPLHPSKIRKRGYNQSDYFAQGLSSSMQKPYSTDCLVREKPSESQTMKSRYERYENMQEIFQVSRPALLVEKHVLLVDDVLTTGATIEACAAALLAIEDVKVSVATIARAQ